MISINCKAEGIKCMFLKVGLDQPVSDIYKIFKQRILPKINSRDYQILQMSEFVKNQISLNP